MKKLNSQIKAPFFSGAFIYAVLQHKKCIIRYFTKRFSPGCKAKTYESKVCFHKTSKSKTYTNQNVLRGGKYMVKLYYKLITVNFSNFLGRRLDAMKKKQMLVTLVMLSVMQSNAYAYNSHNYVVKEDSYWYDIVLEETGAGNHAIYGKDTLTIADGKKLTMDYAGRHEMSQANFPGGLCLYLSYEAGDWTKDINVNGGTITVYGTGNDKVGYGGYIRENATGKIVVDGTDLNFNDLQYGFKIKDSEANITNNNLNLNKTFYAVYTENEGNFTANSKNFSINSAEVGIFSIDNSLASVKDADNILFYNTSCAIYTNNSGEVNINGETLEMINNNFGVSSSGGKVNIDTDTFIFDTDIEIAFPITAIYGGNDADVNVTAKSAELHGQVLASDNAKVSFLEDSDISETQLVKVYSTLADAVSAQSDTGEATINFETNSYINSQGDENYHTNRQGERTISAIRANRNSVITLDNAAGIYGDIIAGRGISGSDAKGGQITINSVDYADFKGDVLAGNSGKIDITLNNKANYEGRVDDYFQASLDNVFRPDEFHDEDGKNVNVEEAGQINLTLNDSQWTARGQNFVSELTLNNGTVDMTSDKRSSVTVNNLSGNGTIKMNLDAESRENGDMLYVIGSHAGEQTIVVNWLNEDGVNAIAEGERIRFATTDGNVGDFKAQTRDAGFFNLAYLTDTDPYDTVNETEENLDYNGVTVEGADNGTDKPGNKFVNETFDNGGINHYIVGIDKSQSEVSDAGKTIINMSRANYSNAIYMDRLNKRMGETRYINPEEEQGMWVRLRHDRIGKTDAFRSQNTMYEMGYDVKQDCDNGERRIGMAIDYMDGKTEYRNVAGDGDIKRYGLWLYDTWTGDKGHYTDFVAKWGHLENDFEIYNSRGKVNGDYSNNVFSVSAEYGKKNDMGKGWYFEPQAQLQLARVTGADYVTSQNTKVSLDGINSLIGRAGFRLGRDLNENSTVYVKADLLHEFLGDQTISAYDITTNGVYRETFENKGTWYDVGFGFATALGKNSYAFMDFEKSFGNDNDETYQVNAGVQWTF